MFDTDIIENNEAQQAIIESDHRYRDLFENMTSGVAVYAAKKNGKTFIIEDFNKAAERITGLKRDLVVGKDAEMIFPGIKEAGLKDAFQRVWKTGKKTHHPVSLYQDERLNLWVENNIYKLPTGHVVAIFDDITERIQVEQKLRDSQQDLDAIMKTVPDIIYRLDTEGNITFVNDAVKKYGYTPDELLGKNVVELVHPDDLNMAVSKLDAKRSGKHNVTNLKIRLLTKDTQTDQIESKPSGINPCFLLTSEELYEFNGSGNKIFTGTQGIARDITDQTQAEKEREKLKAQLLKTQKMEATGTLAGGIAHDFNNILGAIIGYAQLLPLVIPENKIVQGYIEQILMASDRAKSLVQQILAFSRQSTPEQIPVDIGIIIK